MPSLMPVSPFVSAGSIPGVLSKSVLRRLGGIDIGTSLSNRSRTRTRRSARGNIRSRARKGLEINRAEGGFKRITLPTKTLGIGINLYGRLLAQKIGNNWEYRLGMESDNYAGREYLNLTNYLNDSSEFIERLQTSSQYKVLGVNISLGYNRIPAAGDCLSKLILFYNTDKITVNSPRIQTNTMELNMNTTGTKNFNIRLNRSNIKEEHCGWLDSIGLYPAKLLLHVSAMDANFLSESVQTTLTLGTIKITFNVLTRIQDYLKPNQPAKIVPLEEQVSALTSQLKKLCSSQDFEMTAPFLKLISSEKSLEGVDKLSTILEEGPSSDQ
jgi:hypothetical protein